MNSLNSKLLWIKASAKCINVISYTCSCFSQIFALFFFLQMDNQRCSESENFNPNPVYGLNEAQLDILGQRRWKAHRTIWEKLKEKRW